MNYLYMQGVICLHRKVAVKDHKFVYWLAGGFAALSVLLEKKARRGELALYVLPRAGDSLWYILVNRHFLPDIKNAEVITITFFGNHTCIGLWNHSIMLQLLTCYKTPERLKCPHIHFLNLLRTYTVTTQVVIKWQENLGLKCIYIQRPNWNLNIACLVSEITDQVIFYVHVFWCWINMRSMNEQTNKQKKISGIWWLLDLCRWHFSVYVWEESCITWNMNLTPWLHSSEA